MSEELKPCPFCREPLVIGGGFNPIGRCITEGCWMSERQIGVSADAPREVEQWNTRTEPTDAVPTVGEVEPLATQLTGRAQFLRDRGEVKSPQLMEEAAATIRTLSERQPVGDGEVTQADRQRAKLAMTQTYKTEAKFEDALATQFARHRQAAEQRAADRAFEEAAGIVDSMAINFRTGMYQRLMKVSAAIRQRIGGQ